MHLGWKDTTCYPEASVQSLFNKNLVGSFPLGLQDILGGIQIMVPGALQRAINRNTWRSSVEKQEGCCLLWPSVLLASSQGFLKEGVQCPSHPDIKASLSHEVC